MATPNVSERVYTAEEFFRLPDPIEGGKMELVCGRVETHMPPSGRHGEISSSIDHAIRSFVKPRKLGRIVVESGFFIRRNPDTVRAPDVAFFSNERLGKSGLPDEGFVPFSPTLAVEVVSPDDLDRDIAAKVAEYVAVGVERVWVVRPPQRTVTVHHPDGTSRTLTETATLTSDDAGFTVPGFELPVAAIFE